MRNTPPNTDCQPPCTICGKGLASITVTIDTPNPTLDPYELAEWVRRAADEMQWTRRGRVTVGINQH